MSTTLGARSTNAPIPVGHISVQPGGSAGAGPNWPPVDNWILPGDGNNGAIGPYNLPERFWLRAGASIIARTDGGWIRYDYKLSLVVNGVYNYDLLGNLYYQKANSLENHASNGWWGTTIEGMFFCEANTTYNVYLLSVSATASTYYYQHAVHYDLWSYTIGEGVH